MTEVETLRRAVAEIREDWPENREMGMDRNEWRFHRAVADWLDDCAIDLSEVLDGWQPDSHAVTVARASLGWSA